MHLRMADATFPVQLLTSIAVAASCHLRELNVYLSLEDGQMDPEKIPAEAAFAANELAAYTQLDAALCRPILNELKMVVHLYDEGTSMKKAVNWWRDWLPSRLPKFLSGERSLIMKHTLSTSPLRR